MADRTRLRCRLGFHAYRAWALPEGLQGRLLAEHWSWSARKCVYCEWSTVTMLRIERTDGKTGSLHG